MLAVSYTFVSTSQSRVQRHHNRGRQKYCWSYATQQLRENILVIDSVVYFSSSSFSRESCSLILFPPMPLLPPTVPLLLSLPPSPMLSLSGSYKIYPSGRMWTWVMDQQHTSFRTHSNVPKSCFALLPPSCFPHLLSLPSSEVKFFVLSFCTSSVLPLPLYLFPPHFIRLLDTKTSWESIIRTLLWEIKIWYSCVFYLQGFSSVSLCA